MEALSDRSHVTQTTRRQHSRSRGATKRNSQDEERAVDATEPELWTAETPAFARNRQRHHPCDARGLPVASALFAPLSSCSPAADRTA